MKPNHTNRWLLVLILAMFAAPFVVALAMHAFHWRPAGMRNHGELVRPPIDMAGSIVRLEHDALWTWQDANGAWTLMVEVPETCDAACWDAVAMLPRMRLALGRHAPRMRLLLLDRIPPQERRPELAPMQFGAVETLTPGAGWRAPLSGPAAALVHPQGLLVLRYAPGFTVQDIHKDFKRMIR